MPVIKPYDTQVQFNPTTNFRASAEGFGSGLGDALINASKQGHKNADIINAVSEQKSRMRAANQLTQIDLNWRQEMINRQNDPEFTKKYGEDGSGFAEAFKTEFEQQAQQVISEADPRDRKYIEQGMYNLGESLMASSMQYEAEVSAAFTIDTLTKSVDNARVSASMSPDQFTSIMANTQMVINQAPHLNPVKRLELMNEANKSVTLGAVTGLLEKNGVQTAAALLNNSLAFTVFDENGKPTKKKVSELVGADMFEQMRGQADTVLKKVQSDAKNVQAALKDEVVTNIELAETEADFLAIANTIEKNKDVWERKDYNDIRVKFHEKSKNIRDNIASVDRGNAFASGKAYLNPQDNEAVKDYNNYYNNVIEPTLADKKPEARNTLLANMIAETKIVPDRLKGDIRVSARSMDKDIVTQTADFIDRLRATNPHVLQDIDQKDIARIDMVNQRIASGFTPEEAFKQVDELLSPANAAVMEKRVTDLKDAKKDYQSLAVSNFERNWLVRALPGNSMSLTDQSSNFATRQIAQLTSDYKQAYETHYKITGDTTAAEKFANQSVTGMYGVTTINNRNQLMRFPPEKYYSIQGDNTDWMRKQVLQEVEARGPFMLPEGVNIESRVMLVPDPTVTPRTAKEGAPLYKIFYETSDGQLKDMLGPGEYFKFDQEKRRQQLVDEAKSSTRDQSQYVNPLSFK